MFDPQVGLKRFITWLKNLFGPTQRSNTSHKTNYLSFFSLLNQTLKFNNWHLFCVLKYNILMHIFLFGLLGRGIIIVVIISTEH